MQYVKQDNTLANTIQFVYERQEGDEKIKLNHGKEAFETCIEILNNMQPLEPLTLKNELMITVPEVKSLWTDKDYINTMKYQKIEELECIKDNNTFHFDIGSSNPEISLIMQLVDDSVFRGSRRENLLSRDFKYIGIHNRVVDNVSCSYFFFASYDEE